MDLFRRIHKADRTLSLLGWFQLAIALLAVCSAPWDRSALGAESSPWMKVIRYSMGLAVYAWTLALFVQHVPNQAKVLRVVRWGTVACLTVEVLCMLAQAMRGVSAHYNTSNMDNALIFLVVGAAILINTLIAFVVLFLFLWEEVDLPRAYLMGIRLGFVLFTIGSLEGVIMVLNQAHTVGAADGGPGLPFLEWSTRAGDLRIAHMAGIFGLQVLPLAGWATHRLLKDRQPVGQLLLVTAAAGLWVALFLRLFNQAIAGRPLLGA